ncbi:MAG TPA: NAD+ synthase [Miltoncostaeaceae bacterium]|nr:NAD+ synthase [Miltoncostaeaceae bacterium]
MRVALAQLNTVVGDIAGNTALVADALARARAAGAHVTLTPELALTGYPPEDLLLRPAFARDAGEALQEIASGVGDEIAIVGVVEWDRDCFNSAAVLHRGRVAATYRKRFLPNYGVFDEARYFAAGERPLLVDVDGVRIGIAVCEDIWYPAPVTSDLAAAGADLICCLSASPWYRGKGDARERMLATRASDCAAPLAFCNQVGGQDELVFDGRSTLFDAQGTVVARAPQFASHLLVGDLDPSFAVRRRLREPLQRRLVPAREPALVELPAPAPADGAPPPAGIAPPLGPEEEVWRGLVRGLADYVDKNGFGGVVIGLSGGIDSALTAALAVDALGAERVNGVALPSVYTSGQSTDDARALAECLAIHFLVLPIAEVVQSFEDTLAETFAGRARDVTEENLQARARGTLLMALSNKMGWLVLATGNKSEMSVGYSTLYGDMVGGFAPLRDISKTWVYRLARWRNAAEGREVIPSSTIERPPTAELRPDQLDTDSLPSYDDLDPIIEGHVEEDLDVEELVARGHDAQVVARVLRMIARAEYKRRQGPVGIKVTPRAFGKDRRMPITNRYV